MTTLVHPLMADEAFLRLAALRAKKRREESAKERRVQTFSPLPEDGILWVKQAFPSYFQNAAGLPVPMAPHHEEFWRWVWALRPGQPAPSFIQVLPRGGGKSTGVELACVCLAKFGLRRYGLYVSNIQDQADDHVSTVSAMLEYLGIDRSLNRYGFSRGWRINRLRTADGFVLDALGLDGARRGVKIEEQRPDFLVFDDLDSELDTLATTTKKIKTLTRRILPSGSSALTVLGVQNLPNKDGIFAQLVDGRADFLSDRIVSGPYKALEGLEWERETHEDGPTTIRITHGTPSWAGQSIADCEALIRKIGLTSFLIEVQHETERLGGTMFRREWFPIVDDFPRDGRRVRFWDLASTEEHPGKDPDFSAGCAMVEKAGQFWIVDMQHFRARPMGVEDRVRQTAELDERGVEVGMEEEGGASGKNTISHYQRTVLRGFSLTGYRSTGSKPEMAKPLSSAAEAGNVFLVRGKWNAGFLDEAEDFPTGNHDDQVDSAARAHKMLTQHKRAGTWGR